MKRAHHIPVILRNFIDYPLRQLIRLRRSGLVFENESKERLYAHLPANKRTETESEAARLLMDYHLQHFHAHSRADNYRESLFYLSLLEKALNQFSPRLPQSLSAADIGPSHWFYVQVYHPLLRWWRSQAGRQLSLIGYEVDANRVYADFHSRYDHAQAYIRGLEGTSYLPRGFETQTAAFDLITLLFPFVFLEDHLKWGLPVTAFKPQVLLANAWHSLKSGGIFIIVNQGEKEHHEQVQLLAAANIKPADSFRFDSPLYQYDLLRYVIGAIKNG